MREHELSHLSHRDTVVPAIKMEMNSVPVDDKEEDSGYGIFFSDDEISIEPTFHGHGLPRHEPSEGDSSTDDEDGRGGLFCNTKVVKSESKGRRQSSELWRRFTDSSYSSSSEDENEQNASKLERCLFYHRSHKSEGEINSLIASLISFSTSPLTQTETSQDTSNTRPRSNTLPNNSSSTPSVRPVRSEVTCLPLLSSKPWSSKEKQETRKHRRSQESPMTLLPSLNSPWGSFSSIANFLYSEQYSDEEMVMIDGDLPTPDSDLSPRIVNHESTDGTSLQSIQCRSFHVVTTAALPWMTGTSVNPTLRACYLNQMNRNAIEAFSSSTQNSLAYDTTSSPPWECMGTVTLVIPWLIHQKDRQELYGPKHTFQSPSEQEDYIRTWIRDSAKLPLEANIQTHGIRILFYPARYSKELGSIFALGDICNLIPDSDADCCILEEPEHLNWMRPTDAHIPLWTDKFKYVVGIIHTNYKAYAQAHVSGFISAPFIGSLSSLMTRVHCHRIIKLSSCLQSFAPEKEIVSNTHGIRSEFLTKEDMDRQTMDGNYYSPIYFLGKLLWAKGLDKLLQLQYAYRRVTGEFFKIDIYGSGPDEIEIKRTFCGSQEELVKSSESEESYAQENILLREKIVRSIDSFMSDLPSLRHDWKRAPIPCEFHGRVDHVELKGRHKIFVNPSITEVLCTTTAEALAMNNFIIIPHHPSNLFFEEFQPNCLVYKNSMEFITQLQYALSHQPTYLPPDSARKLSWEAATSRFISASITTRRDSCKSIRLGLTKKNDEKAVKFLRSALAGPKGDVIRTMIGGRDVGEQYQFTLKGQEIEKDLLFAGSLLLE